MAAQKLKVPGAKRDVWVKKNRRGLHCVKVEAPKTRKAFKGSVSSGVQFRGCFTSKAKALTRARSLAKVSRLPRGKKR